MFRNTIKRIPSPKFLIILFFFGLFLSFQGINIKSSFILKFFATTPLKSILRLCSQETSKNYFFSCFRNKVRPWVKFFGGPSIIDSLTVLSSDETNKISCHDLAHVVGELAIEEGQDLGKTIAACSRKCGYGCVHGAVLGEIKANPDFINKLDNVCEKFTPAKFPAQDITACKHGLGHGLAEYAAYDIYKSLSLCNGLSEIIAKEECATGVFMEIFDSPTLSHPKFIFPEDIHAFCKSLPLTYSDVCLRNGGNYEYRRSQDPKKAFEFCDLLGRDSISDQCVASLGADWHFSFAGSNSKIIEACEEGSKLQFLKCLEGAIYSNLVSDETGAHAVSLCREVVDSGIRLGCFRSLGITLESIKNEKERNSFCAKLSAEEKLACLEN